MHRLRVAELQDRGERGDAEQHDREQGGAVVEHAAHHPVEHQRGAEAEGERDEDGHGSPRLAAELHQQPHDDRVPGHERPRVLRHLAGRGDGQRRGVAGQGDDVVPAAVPDVREVGVPRAAPRSRRSGPAPSPAPARATSSPGGTRPKSRRRSPTTGSAGSAPATGPGPRARRGRSRASPVSAGGGGQPGPEAVLALRDLAEGDALVVGVGLERVAWAVVDGGDAEGREAGDIRPAVLGPGLAADRREELPGRAGRRAPGGRRRRNRRPSARSRGTARAGGRSPPRRCGSARTGS